MSISGISYLIERLTYEQYLAVNKIGFGGFGAIRANVIAKSLGMILEFTKEDVHATLGLPMGPKKVVEGKTCDSCEKYNALLGSWRRRWGISSGAPKIRKMRDGMLDRGNHGDEFKRDFAIYVEHVNWVIHKHDQLHLSKAINKSITIPIEGSSVSIPGVDMAAYYHEPESCDRIQVDHPSHAKGKIVGETNHTGKYHKGIERPRREIKKLPYKAVDDETTLSAKFKAFIQVDNFHKYMYKTLHLRSRKIKEFDIEYLELPWQDEVNEQYLRLLRPMYCARILMHPINKLRMTVSETVKKFFQQEQ
ncbi:hypothetical protein Cgig2_002309 [Carnegiea gigantea]|uniref:Uncharacterized protein n=1 Tax=Carnegiea gigantea TaxID=171969 RepID=A0A9Q1KUA1_9CARY|nr:hypothetical protein Cgig2_002309 [Carnegiea gigantea]